MIKKLGLAAAAILAMAAFGTPARAEQARERIVRSINDGWTFTKEGLSVKVNIPHCINAEDTRDEVPGYWRGKCSYSRTVQVNDNLQGRKVYVRFEGVGQVAELVVNGISVGIHKGGYTAFVFDVSSAIHNGSNEFVVNVDNSPDPDIPPLSADFTFYGGIYRDVNLMIVPEDHISVSHYASSGVYLSTPVVGSSSVVNARVYVNAKPAGYVIRNTVFDPEGKVAASSEFPVDVQEGNGGVFDTQINVEGCRIWDVDSPAVYRVSTCLCDNNGNVIDEVENPLGFRTFSFDADNGFTLNGRHLKIMGTNRHQDYFEKGNALSDEAHLRDIMLLRDMGGNFLRISHYPQDQIVPQTCDREGMVSSIEIPIIDCITESDAFRNNCVEMAREMVCQNYNHPSVIIWAYMNESMMVVPYSSENEPEKRKHYFEKAVELAEAVNSAIKELDPARYTMIPCESNPERYVESGVGRVPDILGWNHYQGWYSSTFDDFNTAAAKAHATFPDKPLIVTEYGAGIDPRIHSSKPTRFDFSMEYGVAFHKHYINFISETPWIAGSTVWNLNDFYCEKRIDAVPHVNNKGLVGLDRVPKDSYLLHKAVMTRKPFLAIGGRNWKTRSGNEGEKFNVEVYTNASTVTLWHNGKKLRKSKVQGNCASFEIIPVAGDNTLSAQAPGGLRDAVRFNYVPVPKDLSEFVCMNVSLGTDCQFEDAIQGAAWIPEQPYTKGSWGYVGGDRYFRKKKKSGYLGATADILGTDNNPIFQTQRVGIEAFKADVPDGSYYVSLYFSELVKDNPDRVFDVLINGSIVLPAYDISKEDGILNAAIRKFEVDVRDGQGLTISFRPIRGQAVLNAVRIYRCL